jgi:tetratricopeptide (TPR) repeat protein
MKAPGSGRRVRRWVAASLLAGVAVALASPPEVTAESPPPAGSAQALHDEATARLATRRTDDLEVSLRLFSEAARSDPSYARAHVGIATAASLLALYSVAPPRPLLATARAAAVEALRLEPELATAHAAMGLVEYLGGWDFAAAESRFHRAIDLDRTSATTWHWYGMLLMATSRFDAALVAYDRAVSFARGSSLFLVKRASVLAAAGRREAERELRQVVVRFPDSSLAKRELGYLLIGAGRGEDGLALLRGAAELSGGLLDNADLGWAYARTGRRKEAEAIAARLAKTARAAVRRARAAGSAPAGPTPERKRSSAAAEFVSPMDPALVYAGLDRRDDAFRWLDAALEIHDPGLVYLATAPGFAPLRDDPRFEALLSAIGLDESIAAARRNDEAREARERERRERDRKRRERRSRDGEAADPGTEPEGRR